MRLFATFFGLLGLMTAAHAGESAIKIAVVNDQNGPFSAYGGQGSVIAARLAAEDFGNQVLGKPIEILSADHQNKPDLASSIVSQMIEVDGVDAFADGAGSAAALAIQGITRDRSRIFLITGANGDFTGKECSATGFQFSADTYALARATASAVVQQGGKDWYFITADYAFGTSLETQASDVVKEMGGSIVGVSRLPLNTTDFSSELLKAKASGASVIGLANAGTDLVNSIKQAQEYQITSQDIHVTGFLFDVIDVSALGLESAAGIRFVNTFYWDRDDQTRAWAKRFMEASGGKLPGQIHAGTYSAVLHYLRALEAAATDDAAIVADKMREMPVQDMNHKETTIREDGRVLTPLYLNAVKTPAESKGEFDYLHVLETIAGKDAYRPLDAGGCPLVQ